MTRYIFSFSLIAFAVLSRLLPHPPNVAPITALALFGGVYLDKKQSFIIPLAAMVISDYFIGFHSAIVWVYVSFLAIGAMGLWLKNNQNVGATVGATVAGSILFFIVTNFGVWVSSQVTYPHTFSGLVECYTAAIPFFRNTLLGDAVYVGTLFGVYETAKKFIPSLSAQPTV